MAATLGCCLQVKMTSQQEVLFAQEKNIPVIDIRPPEEFSTGHIPGCAPLALPFLQNSLNLAKESVYYL